MTGENEQNGGWKRLIREPFFQFVCLGIAIFGAFRWIDGATVDSDEPKRIVVSDARIKVIREDFRAQRRREPTASELRTEIERWVEEEILLREAHALGLDQEDTIVRRRLVQKMRFLLEDMGRVEPPTEAEVTAWIEAHPDRYRSAPTFSFEHVWLSRGEHGTRLDEDARVLGGRLRAEPAVDTHALGDRFHGGHDFEHVDADDVTRVFGGIFARRVQEAPVGNWVGPVESAYGLHFVRVRARTEPAVDISANIRRQAALDLREQQQQDLSKKVIGRIRSGYQIVQGDRTS